MSFTLAVQALDSRLTPSIDLPYRINFCTHTDAIRYKMAKLNHLFKDDYVFISYKEKLKVEEDRFGFIDYVNYDAYFCGPDILDIAHAVEKYSHLDISHIRKGMKEKVPWLKKNEPDFYETCFHGNDKEFLKKIDSKW